MISKINGAVFSYNQYLNWVQTLVNESKTSGINQSQALVDFTSLNLKRMERIGKTFVATEQLITLSKQVIEKQIWIVIAEAWCGDCAQNLPPINKIAEQFNGLIDLRIITRDDNPEWMQKYHTNGSLSVPKLIAFDTNQKELFTWGARPKLAQQLLSKWKANPEGKTWDDFEKELHTWYAKNKSLSIQSEFENLLSNFLLLKDLNNPIKFIED